MTTASKITHQGDRSSEMLVPFINRTWNCLKYLGIKFAENVLY